MMTQPAGGYLVRRRCTAKPVAAQARSAASAADVAVHHGQRPPRGGEYAATKTASSGDPMISGAPAWHPVPATRSISVPGLDDIKGTHA